MNVIHLCGGLGNQLFQYAFGRVQKEYGINVVYDAGWYQGKNSKLPARSYILDKFNVDVSFGENSRLEKVMEKGFDLSLLKKDGFNFHGYWQYPDYYNCILPILRKELCVKEEYWTKEALDILDEISMVNDSVSIHVRRGDYLQLPDFPVLSLNYYLQALEQIKVKGNIYVFSDDMEWCRSNFKGVRFIHLNEYLDFELMRWCSNNIISRSSFSWWAAYLNSDSDKIVIAPKQQIENKVRQRAVNRGSEVFDPKEWILC